MYLKATIPYMNHMFAENNVKHAQLTRWGMLDWNSIQRTIIIIIIKKMFLFAPSTQPMSCPCFTM